MRRGRHSVFESLVFGLAFLLAGVLSYYAFLRWQGNRDGLSGKGARQAQELEGALPERHGLMSSGTESAVPALPAVRMTSESSRRRSPKRNAVPPPSR